MLNYKMIDIIAIFLLWISAWNITDIFVEKIVPNNCSNTKLIIYGFVLLIAIMLLAKYNTLAKTNKLMNVCAQK